MKNKANIDWGKVPPLKNWEWVPLYLKELENKKRTRKNKQKGVKI